MAGFFAVQQGAHDGVRAVDAAVWIAVRKAGLTRPVVNIAGQGRHAAQRHLGRPVRHITLLRAGLTVARQRGHDDVGLDRAQDLIAQAHFFHHPAGKVLDHNIAFGDELFGQLYPLGLLQIERQGTLALIVLVEIAAAVDARLVVGPGGNHPRRTQPGLTLDPNDFGAQMGQL